MKMRQLAILVVLGLLAPGAQHATAEVWWPDPAYPRPDMASAPDWTKTQKLNFSRWDGGPLETCKGMLSGWPYFNAPWPDAIDATSRWYELKTVDLAEQMGYNFLWLTFSVGYSNDLEKFQWDILKPYVEECHRRGIRVAAYMSSCNMFVDDIFERVPESKEWLLRDDKGEPVPYGAAAYKRMGRTTRMLADITDPRWKDYLKKRIDAALAVGFDAIEYDNTHWAIQGKKSQEQYATFLSKNAFTDSPETRVVYQNEVMSRLFLELLAHARQTKPDVALFININRPLYTIERCCNIISTEDGLEPGYYKFKYEHEVGSPDTLEPDYADAFVDIKATPFDPEMLITNLGKLRLLRGLSEGWKPVLVEFGGRRNGHRLLNQFPPLAFQLAIGECNAALCSLQGYQEGRALLDLYNRKPEVMKSVEAAGRAHRFVSEQQKHFLGAAYKANTAIVLDDRITGHEYLNQLARANCQFEVLFDEAVSPEHVKRFQCVVAFDAKLLSDKAVQALAAYAQGGGALAVYGESGAMDRWGQVRKDNPLAGPGPWTALPKEESAILSFIQEHARPAFEVVDCPYVLYTLTQRAKGGEGGYVAHLLNYQKEPLVNVTVKCHEGKRVQLLALDPACAEVKQGAAEGEWLIPRLGVYSMLLVES